MKRLSRKNLTSSKENFSILYNAYFNNNAYPTNTKTSDTLRISLPQKTIQGDIDGELERLEKFKKDLNKKGFME
jgi:hypothetical protein